MIKRVREASISPEKKIPETIFNTAPVTPAKQKKIATKLLDIQDNQISDQQKTQNVNRLLLSAKKIQATGVAFESPNKTIGRNNRQNKFSENGGRVS